MMSLPPRTRPSLAPQPLRAPPPSPPPPPPRLRSTHCWSLGGWLGGQKLASACSSSGKRCCPNTWRAAASSSTWTGAAGATLRSPGAPRCRAAATPAPWRAGGCCSRGGRASWGEHCGGGVCGSSCGSAYGPAAPSVAQHHLLTMEQVQRAATARRCSTSSARKHSPRPRSSWRSGGGHKVTLTPTTPPNPNPNPILTLSYPIPTILSYPIPIPNPNPTLGTRGRPAASRRGRGGVRA